MKGFPTESIIKSPDLLDTSWSWKGLYMNFSCRPLNGHLRSAWLPLLLYAHSSDYISKIWGNLAGSKWMCLHLAHATVLKLVLQLFPMYKSESDIIEHKWLCASGNKCQDFNSQCLDPRLHNLCVMLPQRNARYKWNLVSRIQKDV